MMIMEVDLIYCTETLWKLCFTFKVKRNRLNLVFCELASSRNEVLENIYYDEEDIMNAWDYPDLSSS
jgi:hypothetical protein